MSMILLYPIRLLAVIATGLCLAGCGKTESYRYKLALAINTPEGVKRGSSVVEALFYEVSIPERGIMHKLRGEALYLDLGPGARPLIALLTSQLHPKYGKEQRWTRDAGPDGNLIYQIYGPPPPQSKNYFDDLPRIARTRGSRGITSADLPDLVTFSDVKDPATVIEVNPNDLQATLGPNITWNEITFESTDEPITSGIRTKLPWIEAYFQKNLLLDGQNLEFPDRKDAANHLGWADFDLSGDLKRK